MKSICITGATAPDLQIVTDILHQSGMKPPIPAKGDAPVDMAFWHEQAMLIASDEADGMAPVTRTGRFWEQLASEIFVANIRSEIWGWADSRSTWLLDFWLNFEPRLNFVLVCTSPQQMLAGVLADGRETVPVDAVMDAWQEHHQELLRFHHRNPQRSVLVDAQDCAANPQALVELCATRWKLPLAAPSAMVVNQGSRDSLGLYLAQQLCLDYPQTASLQQELAATITHLGKAEQAPTVIAAEQLIDDYRTFGNQTAELQLAHGELTRLAKALDQQSQLAAEHQAQLDIRTSTIHALTVDKEVLAHAKSVLELERAALAAHRDALKGEVTTLAQALDQQSQLAAQHQANAESRLQQLGSENDLLLLQAGQLQEELQTIFLQNEAHKTLITASASAIDALTVDHETLAQAKSALELERYALIAQRDALQGEVATLAHARDEQSRLAAERLSKASEAEQESELLLLQLHQVQEELETYFLQNEVHKAQVNEGANAIAALAADKEALAQVKEALELERTVLVAQRDALQTDVATLAHARDEQSRLAAERQVQIDTRASAIAALAADKEALAQVKAALELERTVLAAQRDALQTEVATLAHARDEQSRLAAERQSQIDTRTSANDTLSAEKEALFQDKSALELERAALIAQRDALQGEAASLAHARDEQNRRAAESQSKLKEAEQESELLLLQLHQVQEELEHYFLQHQELQKQQQAAEARWQHMLQRTPDYCDYESIEILPDDGNQGDQSGATWRIRNLNTAGRSLPEIEFKTIVENGIAGFVLTRQPGTTGPLIRWPGNAADANELTLIPAGTSATATHRVESLLDLATGDWELLQTLDRVLTKTLESPAALKAPADFAADALRSGLAKFSQTLLKFPATLRYDQVSLKREQFNPDYEYLWLRIENLSFGEKHWPEFDFRLSSVNVPPNNFGAHPKLEFSEKSGRAVFETWFGEDSDDFGAKLELRFAMPDSMDVPLWQRFSVDDRILLAHLIKYLPVILGALQKSGVQTRRPWADWVKLADEMLRIAVLRTTRTTAPTPAPEAPAPLPAAPVVPREEPPEPVKPTDEAAPAVITIENPRTEAKAEPKTEAKAAPKTVAEMESRTEAKATPKKTTVAKPARTPATRKAKS